MPVFAESCQQPVKLTTAKDCQVFCLRIAYYKTKADVEDFWFYVTTA